MFIHLSPRRRAQRTQPLPSPPIFSARISTVFTTLLHSAAGTRAILDTRYCKKTTSRTAQSGGTTSRINRYWWCKVTEIRLPSRQSLMSLILYRYIRGKLGSVRSPFTCIVFFTLSSSTIACNCKKRRRNVAYAPAFHLFVPWDIDNVQKSKLTIHGRDYI